MGKYFQKVLQNSEELQELNRQRIKILFEAEVVFTRGTAQAEYLNIDPSTLAGTGRQKKRILERCKRRYKDKTKNWNSSGPSEIGSLFCNSSRL